MTTIEDILLLVKGGLYEDALLKVDELEDNLDKVHAVSLIALDIYEKFSDINLALDIMEDAEYITKKIKDPFKKSIALSNVASAYLIIGNRKKGVRLFEKALDEALHIENSGERAIALGKISYHMGISGLIDSALETFEVAFDTVIRSKIDYTQKTDYLIKLGEILEETGDSLSSTGALPFYERAYDLFDKLHVNFKAAILEKKILLAKTLKVCGNPEIRSALLEGRYGHAVAEVKNLLKGEKIAIGLLEIALWMKKLDVFEYKKIVREILEQINSFNYSQEGVAYIATLLTELGSIKEALVFANKIEDVEKKSEALKAIALELAREKELKDAYKIIEMIPDSEIKKKALEELFEIEAAL
ncbi:hypothetical protein [Thermococcus barophilus]|uniref:TRP-repeat-containing protein n=1 Tax=Thermococcus barophilus TaxID=55802 RepID=A0A0S1XDV1_THEBA|nr:hypothetical protein [Thermococcus barophilus]ALM75972.1 hypothetical protein TBCH5v1_2070 [Thermococcus barophilus]